MRRLAISTEGGICDAPIDRLRGQGVSRVRTVIPANAGIHDSAVTSLAEGWIPAFAGMTSGRGAC